MIRVPFQTAPWSRAPLLIQVERIATRMPKRPFDKINQVKHVDKLLFLNGFVGGWRLNIGSSAMTRRMIKDGKIRGCTPQFSRHLGL